MDLRCLTPPRPDRLLPISELTCLRKRKVRDANVFRYGQPLVQYDPKAESRLRLKIDLFIVPTVALLYLFCFIDRANIGMGQPAIIKGID